MELACSAKLRRVFLPLDPSGESNLVLVARKIKKTCPLLQQISIKKIGPLYYIAIVVVDGQFAAYAVKTYIAAERMRNW